MKSAVALACLIIGCTRESELVKTVAEDPGAHCAYGGVAILVGTDHNGDGKLEDAEIETTSYVCNGAPGGVALVDVAPEPVGPNCLNGGTAVRTGTDQNHNQMLDANEIQQTVYVCNGPNGVTQLVLTRAEPAGANCPYGGIAIIVGPDTNGDGVLSSDEVTSTSYVCNGNT